MTLKRRVTSAGSPEGSGKTQKRRRVSTYVPQTEESAERTTEGAQQLLGQIKEATDKYGRLIATEFLDLPDRNEYPEYYTTIRLPISLNIIEQRLKDHEYPNMTPVESDLRRMVSNAKFYNEKGSLLFSNAERIRKMIASTMPNINPAYQDPNYAPFSTPVPEPDEDESVQPAAEADTEPAETEPEPPEKTPSRPLTANRPSTAERDPDPGANTESSFEGKTFEAAQEKIISEMIRLKDADGEEVFGPFINKPDRTMYKQYYDIIKHPVSLRTILKRVRGTDRRKTSTQKNPFRTWRAFEEEVSYIWNNARVFNEEGSDIVESAGALEDHFHQRLAEAQKVVPEPPQSNDEQAPPRIKLKMGNAKTPEPPSQKIMLKLPGRAEESATRQDGVTVDNEALKRQQALVQAGTNGTETSRRSTSSRSLRDRSASGARPTSSTSRRAPNGDVQQLANDSSPTAEGSTVKPESSAPQTPNLDAVAAQTHPNGAHPPTTSKNAQESVAAQTQEESAEPLSNSDTALSGSNPKKPGRDVRKALLRNVDVTTNKVLNLKQDFHLDIAPSPEHTQTVTINLPPSHHLLSISPTFAASSLQRQTSLVVRAGMERLVPAASQPIAATDTQLRRFDVRLGTGVNKIDVEMFSTQHRVPISNFPSRPTPGFEYERVTIFANLMRASHS